MEFFDPKTRPVAVFWDADALLSAPPACDDEGVSVFWRAVMNLGTTHMTPLVEGDRLQAFRLARNALPRLVDATDPAPRIELCAAAYLQNRDATMAGRWSRSIGSGASCMPTPPPCSICTAMSRRRGEHGLDPDGPAPLRQPGSGGDVRHRPCARRGQEGDDMSAAPERAAAELERLFQDAGMPVRLSQLGIPRASLDVVLENSLKNFNADPKREFVHHRDALRAALDAAW